MGIKDWFKRKDKEQQIQEQKTPTSFDLKYSSGDIAIVTFNGIVEVEGRRLHNVVVTYIAPDSTFKQKKVLLEPMYQGDNDVTESYYASMAVMPNVNSTPEQRKYYNDVKGFFKKQQVEALESDYLGALTYDEKGTPHREYDNDFRTRYAEIYKAKETAKRVGIDARIAEEQAKSKSKRDSLMNEGLLQQQLMGQTYGEEDTRGYAGILTAEDYREQYGTRQQEDDLSK